MKTTLLALAALLASPCAGAQSNVTLYGIIDAGVGVTNHASNDQHTAIKVNSGGMNISRWGLRGNEDLGGGLNAVFQLEGGILLDTGAYDTVLFKRQANVGLEGELGRIVVGRSFTTSYDFLLPFDPLGYASYYSWAPSGNASGASKYGMTTAADNLVKYSAKAGDFIVGASYGFGEQTGSNTDNTKLALGGTYLHGPLALVTTYERINGNTEPATGHRSTTIAWHAGAMYTVDGVKLQAVARDFRQTAPGAASVDVRATLYWCGVTVPVAPALALTGALYYQDVKNVRAGTDADPTMLVLRLRYALSKRTDLYAVGGYTHSQHGQMVSLSRDESGFADHQAGIMIGIQHRF
jgi:predicted porin